MITIAVVAVRRIREPDFLGSEMILRYHIFVVVALAVTMEWRKISSVFLLFFSLDSTQLREACRQISKSKPE